MGPIHRRGRAIYIEHLSLSNFRNYESLELDLEPGMVLIQGDNGQGKSNLLEAIYLLAIAKSPRASADRELIRWQAGQEDTYTGISAVIHRDGKPLKVQVDLRAVSPPTAWSTTPNNDGVQGRGSEGASVQKYIRVNGVPRRASDLVGQVNAVIFSAGDMELVYGSPTVRRRYLDILISQLDNRYLRVLQRYHRVVYQRNHLLRTIREGGSRLDELVYWDDELVSEGAHLIARRMRTVERLSELTGPLHKALSDNGEVLEIAYAPSVPIGSAESEEGLAESFKKTLDERRQREIAQGFTVSGPHRDDLQMLIDGMDAGAYASRGQARTAVLSMRLAEARYLAEERGQEPLLLLDDVLSELDSGRRNQVLDSASRYQQCLITTTETGFIGEDFLSQMSRFVVRQGRIEAVGEAADPGTE